MTELPDDIRRALAELPREQEPDSALEDRVVRAVFGRRRRWLWGGALAAAAALLLVLSHPWSRRTGIGDRYVLFLTADSTFIQAPPGQMGRREHEYSLWSDSLAALGKLDLAAKLLGQGEVQGMFIIRAANDAEAARIAATCPHNKYRGHIEIRRFAR